MLNRTPKFELSQFSPATKAWFENSFVAPTPAQSGAWQAIAAKQHTLVVAPTGSGKTLAAFLWAIDQLARQPETDPHKRCRVLYISPLKALAVDVDKNLRAPLVGIAQAARGLGTESPDISVAVRTGDTSPAERRTFAKNSADILITTPESLFLLLSSQARTSLAGVQTIIIDEIHALAGTKRGAHMALSLERLDALLPEPATRVGLSATVRPVDEVARFLGGARPVQVVAPPADKRWDLQLVVPVADMAAPEEPSAEHNQIDGPLWPHVLDRIVDLISTHRSTLVFANSRRLAERITARLNEIWQNRLDEQTVRDPLLPAQVMASGRCEGAANVLAAAHHGSVSRLRRTEIESQLKAGTLPAVVATSSLELGIDMGAVDLVIQVESPPSVASGLQRIGRAGHQVGATSKGVLFPKFRGDLVTMSVVAQRMMAGEIEEIKLPINPLDVLSQQIVAMCAMDDWALNDLATVVRRCANFTTLPSSLLTATMDMLAGRYPSDDFAELKPRIIWDRHTDVLSARPGAQRLAVLSGGTIPDRGLYGVFLAGEAGPGRRVGELDEEMVYESRVGDVFALGSSSWRIQDITHDQVIVTPAPGAAARLPFWRGDQPGRPAELGRAVGAFVRDVGNGTMGASELAEIGLDPNAVSNLLAYVGEQKAAIATLPTDTTLLIERFRDDIGDWRICLHSPFGARVHTPWALIVEARLRERFGIDVDAVASDDGIVLRLADFADSSDEPAWAADLAEMFAVSPDEVLPLLTTHLGSSAVFAGRFRECASRALLLPRRRPDRRQPLWQQRRRSAQLLEVAAQFPDFPIVLETVRECVDDVFDVAALNQLLRDLGSGAIRMVEAISHVPSPFARALSFGYIGQFLYEGDAPLAERRAAALTLDPQLLSDLLAAHDAPSLRDLLDPDAVRSVHQELQRLSPDYVCRNAEDIVDTLRVLGPLSLDGVQARCESAAQAEQWVVELQQAGRIVEVRIGGRARLACVEDVARLRDGLGTPVPLGVPSSLLESSVDPLESLLHRYARTRGPFPATEAAVEFGLGTAVVTPILQRLAQRGIVVQGEFTPDQEVQGSQEFCGVDVLRRLRRRSLAALRQEIEPVSAGALARFLVTWQHADQNLTGIDGVSAALARLEGIALPCSAWESIVLPARVRDFEPGMLDFLLSRGDVAWQGHGRIGQRDGWVSLHSTELAHVTMAAPKLDDLSAQQRQLLDAMGAGSYFAADIAARVERSVDRELIADLWECVWAGALAGDTWMPLRDWLARRATATTSTPRRESCPTRLGALRGLQRTRVPAPVSLSGRWSALRVEAVADTVQALVTAELALERYGILTRDGIAQTPVPGGFTPIYGVLRAAEESGRIRRGYFVEGLGGAQFGLPGAVDRLRAAAKKHSEQDQYALSPLAHVRGDTPTVTLLAATDPASPYGALLPWPDHSMPHRPGRKPGALVVLIDGALAAYVEKGGKTVLTFDTRHNMIADALAAAVARRRCGSLHIETIDGAPALEESLGLHKALISAGFVRSPRGLRRRAHTLT